MSLTETKQYGYESYSPRTPRLLIVDDSEVNRTLLERMFTTNGFDTDVAADGAEALEALQEGDYDLVLMDIMMPFMDGLTALEHIRTAEDTASLPVVLISAMSDVDDIVRGLEMGANDYITKPVDMEIALARVRTQVSLKFLMDERKDTIRRMEESQKMREQFFRMASHDLKGPLTSMRVSQSLLKTMIDEEDERGQRVLDTMRVTVDSMIQVVEDFLDTAALQSGELDIQTARTEALDLLRDVIAAQMPYAHDKRVEIEVAEVGGALLCDRARTTQVLSNLLNNAIKYSPQESTVTVAAAVDGDMVLITVTDEGPGIPEGERVRLFQPFGKLSTKPTGGESSHGLGLWIAHHLTSLQDGEIGVEPVAGGGSSFWVRLPAAT